MSTPKNPLVGIAGRPAGETWYRLEVMDQLNRTPLLGVAGVNSHPLRHVTEAVTGCVPNPLLGVAGNINSSLDYVKDAVGLGRNPRPEGRKPVYRTFELARTRSCWFSDWTYLVGRDRATGQLRLKPGYEATYGRVQRKIPLFTDCGSFRVHSGAKDVEPWSNYANYKKALTFLRPEGYAAYDYPGDRKKSMDLLHDLMDSFPGDVDTRMWPIFSARWVQPQRFINPSLLPPLWRRIGTANLASLVPSPVPPKTPAQKGAYTKWNRGVEGWAEKTVALAISIARDPDFQYMASTFGKVMIGGLNKMKVPGMIYDKKLKRMVPGMRWETEEEVPTSRCTRHLLALVLRHMYPDLQIWLLGQASYVVANGLGMHDQLQDFFMDGCWYLNDGKAERIAVYNRKYKVIRTQQVLVIDNKDEDAEEEIMGLTREMLFCANLTALLSAYCGLNSWPALPEPVDLSEPDTMADLIRQAKQARLDLGEAMGGVA